MEDKNLTWMIGIMIPMYLFSTLVEEMLFRVTQETGFGLLVMANLLVGMVITLLFKGGKERLPQSDKEPEQITHLEMFSFGLLAFSTLFLWFVPGFNMRKPQ